MTAIRFETRKVNRDSMINKIRSFLNNDKNRELLTYLVFGVLTTLISWLVYFGLTAILKPENYIDGSSAQRLILHGSQWVSWIISMLFAFFTNKHYVFKSTQKKAGAWKEFFQFASARLLAYFIFDALLYDAFIYLLGVDHRITKLIMNILVVIFNYFASKLVIFKKKRG